MMPPPRDDVEAVAVAELPPFWSSLFRDRHGQADEAALVLVFGVMVLTVGAFIITTSHDNFPLVEYATALCALLPLYKAARGDFRRP